MTDEPKLNAVAPAEPEHTDLTKAIIVMMSNQVDVIAAAVKAVTDEELNAAIEEWGVGQGTDKPWFVTRWAPYVRPQLLREQRRREHLHG